MSQWGIEKTVNGARFCPWVDTQAFVETDGSAYIQDIVLVHVGKKTSKEEAFSTLSNLMQQFKDRPYHTWLDFQAVNQGKEQEKKFLEGVDTEIDVQLWAAVEYSGRAKAVEVEAIVKACNCHYDLLEACKELEHCASMAALEDNSEGNPEAVALRKALSEARAAIAKAED